MQKNYTTDEILLKTLNPGHIFIHIKRLRGPEDN